MSAGEWLSFIEGGGAQMKEVFVSSPKMTIWVETTDDNIVHNTAPITQQFIGQPLRNLTRWMRRQGFVTVRKLERGQAKRQ